MIASFAAALSKRFFTIGTVDLCCGGVPWNAIKGSERLVLLVFSTCVLTHQTITLIINIQGPLFDWFWRSSFLPIKSRDHHTRKCTFPTTFCPIDGLFRTAAEVFFRLFLVVFEQFGEKMVSRSNKRQRRAGSEQESPPREETQTDQQHVEQPPQQEEAESAAPPTTQPLLPNLPPDPSTLVALDLLVPVPPVDQREFLDWGALQAYVGAYAQRTHQVRYSP